MICLRSVMDGIGMQMRFGGVKRPVINEAEKRLREGGVKMKTVAEIGLKSRAKRVWDQADGVQNPVWLLTKQENRKIIHIAGLGDVGRNVALGLTMDGGDVVKKIGLYDLDANQCARMEAELSQIAGPPGSKRIPTVRKITWNEVFDCDIFLFCATGSVPAVGSGVTDVRMAQYEVNRKIVALYAQEAARRRYPGLFVVVSDPVDLLAMEALRTSWEVKGDTVRPMNPSQIRGCGLGVMNARAMYYARKNPEFYLYEKEGRAFGPHGIGLVIANSINPAHYDDQVSEKLTNLTIHANMEVRKLGFKPYMAPAISSAVFTILALIRGEWQYSAAYLNGLYFGALNRQTACGIEWETDMLPEKLMCRLEASYYKLEKIIWGLH